MSSEDEQLEFCSKSEIKLNFLKHYWLVELICDHKICLKCIMADYLQVKDEVFIKNVIFPKK